MRSGCSICIRWDCCKDRFDPTRPFARFAVWRIPIVSAYGQNTWLCPMEDTYCFGIRSEHVALPNGGYLLFRHTVRTRGFAQWRIHIVSAYGQNTWLCPMEDTYCFGIRSEHVALPN